MAEKNKIIAHGCGGGGISLCGKVLKMVDELGDGFAKIEFNYMDTSDNNIKEIEHDPSKFWWVKSKGFNSSDICGSGGERKTNAEDIAINVKEYLDKHKYLTKHTNQYHMIVTSGSGGSGSAIAPYLMHNLLQKNIPVLLVVIGDSSNAMYVKNTYDTLNTFDNIAKKQNKRVATVYVNNNSYIEHGIMEAEKKANKVLFNTLSTISLFLSGVNESLDFKDMEGLIEGSHFSSLKLPYGIFGIGVFSKKIEIPKNSLPGIARALTKVGESPDTGIIFGHYKYGFVADDNAKEIYESQFPLYLCTFGNYFVNEISALAKTRESFDEMMRSVQNTSIEVHSESTVDDDGFVF